MRGFVTVVVSCAVAGMALGGVLTPAVAQTELGLSFADGPLTRSWAQVERGTAVQLCNEGSRRAENVSVTLPEFSFADSTGAAIDTPKVIVATPARDTLAAGSCADVVVKAPDAGTTQPSKDAIQGLLSASASGAGVARRSLTVSGPPGANAAPKPVPVKGGEQKIEVIRRIGGGAYSAQLVVPIPPALKAYAAGDKAASAAARRLKLPGKVLGGVVRGKGVAVVKRTGKWDTSSGVAKLAISIDGLDDTGGYSGQLNLAGTGTADDAFKLEVELKDSVWWAVLALLVGAALVILPELFLRRWRIEWQLHKWRREIGPRYGRGKVNRTPPPGFGDLTPPHDFEPPTTKMVEGYSDSLDTAIRTYAESTWYYDTTSKPYAKILTSIERAREDASYLYAEDGLAKALDDLRTAVEDLARFVRESRFRADRTPAIVIAAAGLLRGKTLEVGEAKTRGKRAKEHTELIATWIDLARQMLRHQLWAAALANRALNDADKEALAVATGKVNEARRELLEAGDAATLKRLGTPGELEAGYAALATLGGRYGVWVTPGSADSEPRVETTGTPLDLREDDLARCLGPSVWPDEAPRQSVTALVAKTETATASPAEPVVLRHSRRWVGDVAVLLLGVAAATVTALDEVYFGKSFGSTEDYVKLVFAGTAGAGIAKGLTGTLVTLRGGTLSPPTESDPKPAG